MQVRQVYADGGVEQHIMRPLEMVSAFKILPRDLRLLKTRGANIAVRPDYFLFRLPPFTGCVRRDSCLLLTDGPSAATDVLQQGHLQEVIQVRNPVFIDVHVFVFLTSPLYFLLFFIVILTVVEFNVGVAIIDCNAINQLKLIPIIVAVTTDAVVKTIRIYGRESDLLLLGLGSSLSVSSSVSSS